MEDKGKYQLEKWLDRDTLAGFNMTCDCGSHKLVVMIDFDEHQYFDDVKAGVQEKMVKYLSIKFYAEDCGKYYFLESWWKRIKDCWEILTTGKLEYTGEFLFRSSEQVDEFAKVLGNWRTILNEEKIKAEVQTRINRVNGKTTD